MSTVVQTKERVKNARFREVMLNYISHSREEGEAMRQGAKEREREVRSSFKCMVFQHSIIRFESEWLPRGAIHLHVAWVSCIDDRLPMIDSTPCEFLKEYQTEWRKNVGKVSPLMNLSSLPPRAPHTTLHFCLAFFSRFEFKLNQCTWCRCSDELRFESNLLTHFDYWFRSQQQIEFESVMCSHTIWYVYTSIISNSVLNFAFHTESSLANSRKRFQVDAVAVLWVPSLHQQ